MGSVGGSARASPRTNSPGPPERPVSPPRVSRRDKRPSSNQNVAWSTPSRENPSSRIERDEWFQGIFSVTLFFRKNPCLLKTNSEMWLGQQSEVVMMRLREKILEIAEESEQDLDAVSSELCMTHGLPWEKAWLMFRCRVLEHQLESTKASLAASFRHKVKVDAMREKGWSTGSDFSNRNLKAKAKHRVKK